ncbi:MAG: GlxA family transcriptional regulator [Salaquimonas sp.]
MNYTDKIPTDIDILILDDATMLTAASIIDPLRAANRLSDRKLFNWRICSTDGQLVHLKGGFQVVAEAAFTDIQKPIGNDNCLIVIASFNHQQQTTPRLIQQLRKQGVRYPLICGVEAGAWLLARAGLVTNHQITTHWEDLDDIARRYPDLDVLADRYVIDRKIWTCGGASPALDMMLKLIEIRHGKALALEVASVFIYDQMHASTDSQPILSLGRLENDEPRIAAAVRLMEKNIEAPLPIGKIAEKMSVSVKTMELLFRKHLGQTPGKYNLRLRLNAARKLLLDTSLSILDISIRCGFESQSSFSRCFKRQFQQPPSSIRKTL